MYTDMFRGAAWGSHLLVNGETVGYRPLGVSGNEVSITAVFTRRQVTPMNASDARQFVDGGDLRFLESDIGTTVDVRDTVSVDSKIYAVTFVQQRTPVVQVTLEHRDDKRVGNRGRVTR